MLFSFPKPTFACGAFDINCKINDWLSNNVEHSEEAGMKWIRTQVTQPDDLTYDSSTIKWLAINKMVGWSLFALFLIFRLSANAGSPLMSGKLHFEQTNVFLTSILSGFMIYGGDEFVGMVREYSVSITDVYANINFVFPVSPNDFEGAGYQLLGLILLTLLIILWIALYALYLVRGMMINFLITAIPLVGGTMVYSNTFFNIWWKFLLTFIIMKPIHTWGISYCLDFMSSMDSGNPIGKILLAIFFFLFILILPVIIMGNAVSSTLRLMKEGGV